jgi:hypothetical protein
MQVKSLDFVVLGIAVFMFAGSISLTVAKKGKPEVNVHASKNDYVYPLNKDQDLIFSGPIGKTYVEIKSGKVRVTKDPGPRQICVIQGWINSPGQWLICLPNRVMIQIEGAPAKKADIDILSY